MKNNNGVASVILIIIIVAVLAVGGVVYYAGTKNDSVPQDISENLVGNDKDEHGCIGSAGYSWCAEKKKCLRVWEEKCEITPSVAVENMTVKIYFAKKSSLDNLQCSSDIKENDLDFVYRTIPKTQAVARASIEELLKGLTQKESEWYSSDIPDGTYLKSITITNGEALIDFNGTIENGVTSCSGAIRLLQIRQTLLQFSTIKTVKFSVNGRTEDIFQP
ncbi:MAG: GerMN domain-containing protein [Patescibacteria group bacterium]